MRPKVTRRADADDALAPVPKPRDTSGDTRPRHGARKRCADPNGTGCRHYARRNSDNCRYCGGGTRTSTKHRLNPETGEVTRKDTGLVRIPPRVQALLDGTLSVDDLTDEELAHGYPKAQDGSFRGPPDIIPRVMYNQMRRKLFERANNELSSGLVDMAKLMIKFANDQTVDPKLRADCAKWVMERIMGKSTETITLNVGKYETIFDGIDRSVRVDPGAQDDGRTA